MKYGKLMGREIDDDENVELAGIESSLIILPDDDTIDSGEITIGARVFS